MRNKKNGWVGKALAWIDDLFVLHGEARLAQIALETTREEAKALELEKVLAAMRKRAEARAKKVKLEKEIAALNAPQVDEVKKISERRA